MRTVTYELNAHVATLTLNRPEALNALNLAMIDDLRESSARAAFDPQVRAVVLRGAGDHFMAGGDLKWFRDQLDAAASRSASSASKR
jgi:2-(1,2-epoxy-1,2-dihydrophenyl)acetyl-CoA isomerase